MKAFHLPSKRDLLREKYFYVKLIDNLGKVAVKNKLYLSSGSLPFYTDEAIFNTNILFDGVNETMHLYHKQKLFGKESDVFSPGSESVCVSIEKFRVSGLICFDLRFPELFRTANNRASDIFIVHAAWPSARIDQWQILLKARAIENQAYVIGCNGVGIQGSTQLGGGSVVVSPRGQILDSLGLSPGELLVDLDPKEVIGFRNEIPVISNFLCS